MVSSLFVYFVAFNFFLPSVFFFLCVFLFMFLYKSVFIFLFCIIFFLMCYKCQNINIIYIYLNAYLCFYLSISFAFSLSFQWIFFSCLSKFVFCFPLDEIVVFLIFIYLLILYDRVSLCFVVCFSSWLLGFYVFIYLIKYVYAFCSDSSRFIFWFSISSFCMFPPFCFFCYNLMVFYVHLLSACFSFCLSLYLFDLLFKHTNK